MAEALQKVLGVVADGWYGNQTRLAHLTVLEARGLPTDGVPVPPTATTEATTEGEVTTEAPAETTTTEAPAEGETTTTEAPAETTTTEAPAETTTTTTVTG